MKNQKGITLIALIITILVMLILAVVTINLVIDEDGILSRAQNATTKMSLAEIKERAELVAIDLKTDIKIGNYTAKNFRNEYFDRMQEELGENNCKCNGNEVEIQIENGKAYVTINNNFEVTVFNAEDKKKNAEEIALIYIDMLQKKISQEEGMKKLQDKNVIELLEVEFNGEDYIYVYNLNVLYNVSKGGEYIQNEKNPELYAFLENLTVGKNELEKFLIGMSVIELLESTSNDIIGEGVIQDIKNKSEKITNIDKFRISVWNGIGNLYINNVTVLNNGREITFGYDTGFTIKVDGEEGIITKVIIDYGT